MASSTPPEPSPSEVELDATGFDPKVYIRTHYATTGFGEYSNSELLAIDDVEQEADLAIKFLVQTHLSTFIECKDAMDALYEKEEELFLGNALDPTKEQFRAALETVVSTTEPLVHIFSRMQRLDGQQETLSKLLSILRVPGLLYQSCGCTVVDQEFSEAEPARAANSNQPSDDDDGTDDGNSATNERRKAANERLKDSDATEWWCGVPLTRVGGPLVVADPASFAALEFDAGVQALRSAIKFLEEHHNLVTGASNELSTDAPDEGKHADASHRTTPGATPSRGTSPAGTPTTASERPLPGAPSGARASSFNKTSRFAYGYAHALLCASLYLCDTLYKALYAADAADAVRVENLLELLLEATIASTRLRHFCAVVREQLLETTATGHALHDLERALGEHEDDDDARSSEVGGAAPSEINTIKSGHSDQSAPVGARPARDGGENDEGPGLGGGSPSVDASFDGRQQLHPVQAFLEATRHHHSVAILRAADTWARDGARVTAASESARRRDAVTVGSSSPNASRMPRLGATVHAYTIGGLGDSFAAAAAHPPPPSDALRQVHQSDPDTEALMGTITIDDAAATLGSIVAAASNTTIDAATLEYVREQQPEYLQQEAPAGTSDAALRASRRYIERSVLLGGTLQLRPVIEGTADALLDRALSLARRVEDRSTSLPQILQQCDAIHTPLLGFVQSILTDLEHRVSSYWRGVGAAVHSGNFDVPLGDTDPLTLAIRGRGLVQQGTMDPRHVPTNADESTPDDMVVSKLPGLRFVPLVPTDPGGPAVEPTGKAPNAAPKLLLPHSVHCVQRMISNAADIVQRAVRAFGRYMSSNGWLLSLLSDDVVSSGGGNTTTTTTASRLDVACCVAIEIILSHMESLLAVVQQATMRIKTSIAETARQDLVTTEGHLEAISQVLTAVEDARATMNRSLLFACELLVKTFLLSNIAVVCADPGSAGDVAARLTRQYVSTSIPTKCFNVLLVMVERLGGLVLRADDEVRQGLELMFSHPSAQQPTAAAQETASSVTTHRSRRKGKKDVVAAPANATRPAAAQDPVAIAVFQFNAQLVLATTARTEEIIQVMCANLIVSSIDACHLRCHGLGGETTANNHAAQQRHNIHAVPIEVECLADLQCLARVLPAVVVEHILVPTLFTVCATLTQPTPPSATTAGSASTSSSTKAVLAAAKQKGALFGTQFFPLFEEMSFVAMEAILARMVSNAQAEVSDCITRGGFVAPGMDWSDYGPAGGPGSHLSDHTTTPPIRVRHYLVDCLVVAARLQEAMTALNVPAIAFAGVLRIGACVATTLVSALHTSACSCFEMPREDSPKFYIYGLLLLEAEARFCISALTSLVEASQPIQTAASSNADAARVQAAAAEVVTGIELVEALAKQLRTMGTQACEHIAASKKHEVNADLFDVLVPTPTERAAWLDAAVHHALTCSSLVVEALCSYVDAASTSGAAPKAMSTAFAELIQQRTAKAAPRVDASGAPEGGPPQHASRLKNRFAVGDAASHKSLPHVQIKEPQPSDDDTGHEALHPPAVVRRALRKKKHAQAPTNEVVVEEGPPATTSKRRVGKTTDERQATEKPKRDRFKR